MRARLLVAISLAICAGLPARVAADDMDPASDDWNGLSGFVQIAADEGVPLEVVTRLDIGSLTSSDALILIHPTRELPAEALTNFMRSGGRVALLDDFGMGSSLLGTFRITRARPSASDALRLRGNPALLVARPVSSHPLTRDVSALVTNHPQVIGHHELEPIYSLGRDQALVLAGAVGGGRLVAVADSSVVINNMLELGGNRRFAANLFRYLAGSQVASADQSAAPQGRIILVPPDGVIVGRYGEPGADRPLHDVRAFIERLAEAQLPPAAMRIAAGALAGVLLFMAAGLLPRRSPYGGGAMFARPAAAGGFVGRVQWFARRRTDLGEPMVVYKMEFETELSRLLGLRMPHAPGDHSSRGVRPIGVEEVARAMKQRGLAERDVTAVRTLLSALGEVEREVVGGVRGEPVGERRMRRLFQEGEAILARLEGAQT